MSRTARKYLERRADLARWPLQGAADGEGVELVVAIPALAEYPALLDVLGDLEQAPAHVRDRTLCIVVVNHRETAEAGIKANNRMTLGALADWSGGLRVAYVDAASPGGELGPKEGVGSARKAGLDWALAVLAKVNRLSGGLVCLDADCRVGPEYLPALHSFFAAPNRWAAVLGYAHPTEGASPERTAIQYYELFLRYHELGLAFAQSPYAFPTIGSAMACTGEAYAAVSGMNRRQAGEDFYFLQQLAKTGPVDRLDEVTVRPASRPSDRVPFGTGQRVRRFLGSHEEACRVYHPESYRVLRDWLALVRAGQADPAEKLIEAAGEIHPGLRAYLEGQDFSAVWTRLRRDFGGTPRMEAAFHTWFDGFRTLKLIHHLRDTSLPEQALWPAAGGLLEAMGLWDAADVSWQAGESAEGRCSLLARLRLWCVACAVPAGLRPRG